MQSQLIHAMIKDTLNNSKENKEIVCATVHQFQGSEKDIIIYDAVDCYRMKYPSILITSNKNKYADRLFNVAFTRAKGKFVCVVNTSYMKNRNLLKTLMFPKMLETYSKNETVLDGENFTKFQMHTPEANFQFLDKESDELFLLDIVNAKHEIRIDIPDKPKNRKKYLQELFNTLNEAKKKRVNVVVRTGLKDTLPDILKPIAIETKLAVNPVAIIDRKIIWFGKPDSDAEFKTQARELPIKYRPIIRFVGKTTANLLYGLLQMEKTIDQDKKPTINSDGKMISDTFANYVSLNKKCRKCGAPMVLRKKNGFFISCSKYPDCAHTELIDVKLVDAYLYGDDEEKSKCPICKYSLEAKVGSHGIYVECGGIDRHRFGIDKI